MKLYLKGHDYKYAAEQIMFAMFPDAREDNGDTAESAFFRGDKFLTVRTVIERAGVRAAGIARAPALGHKDKIAEKRAEQYAVKLSFYRAAVRILGKEPVWGAVTGVRPGTLFTKMLEDGMPERRAIREMKRRYFVSDERIRLCADTAKASLDIQKTLSDNDIALYIGIPFCPTRCAYCSFVSQSVERSLELVEPFLSALEKEIEAAAAAVKEAGKNVVSVYIGGGTPTTLSAEQLTGLLGKLRSEFDLSRLREFCVEAGRPDTITEDKIRVLNDNGVTRISINPQTMNDDVLSAIGRRHTAEDIRKAYSLTREYCACAVNMDIIAGLTSDTAESFKKTLDEVIAMSPEDITVHTLALKRGARLSEGRSDLPDENAVAAMIDYANAALRQAGYSPYYLYRQKFMSGGFENTGWSRKENGSLYNVIIMEELSTVLALGAGASTKLVDRENGHISRVFNPKYPLEYINTIEKTAENKRNIFSNNGGEGE